MLSVVPLECTDSIKINRPGYNIHKVRTERIFDSPPFIYNKIFLKELSYKFVDHIFKLLLAPFCVEIGQLAAARVFSRGPDPRGIPDPRMIGDPRSPTFVPGAPSGMKIEFFLEFSLTFP